MADLLMTLCSSEADAQAVQQFLGGDSTIHGPYQGPVDFVQLSESKPNDRGNRRLITHCEKEGLELSNFYLVITLDS